ncbi:MAG: hypothetical protein ACRDN0_06040, partial [Trebonia sp.]
MRDPVPVRKGRDVEIVPDLITPNDQVSRYAQGLVRGRYSEYVSGWQRHLSDFQGPVPDELADAGLDIAQLAQDDLP